MDHSVAPDSMLQELKGQGLEIGAFQCPQFVPFGEVKYVDLVSRQEALRFYPEVPLAVPAVEPDILAPAHQLSDIADASQDFVIASHLLEHTQDPIAALLEWHRVLKEGGLLYLCLPQMTHTFDENRQRTSLEHLIGDHAAATPSELDERNREHFREWAQEINGLQDPAQRDFWADLQQRIAYPIHFHCWVPADIEELLDHLKSAEKAEFAILEADVMREGYEFCFLLRKC